jgi:hypothetical protein
MRIRIPAVLVRSWDTFCDWGNIALLEHGRFEMRRLDLLLTAFFVLCVSWYSYFYGWQDGVKGGALFVLLAIGAMLFRK